MLSMAVTGVSCPMVAGRPSMKSTRPFCAGLPGGRASSTVCEKASGNCSCTVKAKYTIVIEQRLLDILVKGTLTAKGERMFALIPAINVTERIEVGTRLG